MNKGFLRPSLLAASVASIFTLTAGQVQAAGFQLAPQNGSGLGNAYAGQAAAAEDASTVWFNPAGMTNIRGRQAVGAINLIKPSDEFSNSSSTTPSLPAAGPLGNLGHALGGNGGDAGDLAAVPNAYLSWELQPNKLWLGIGLNVPFGLKTEWDSDWVGRFHAIKSEVQGINVNPSIAWKVNEMFSLGGGINIMKFDAELTNAVSYRAAAVGAAAVVGPGILAGVPAASEGVGKVEGDDWGWGWNIGAMINFSPATRLGIAYRSEIDFTLEGDAKFSNRPAALNAIVPDGDIEADVDLPATFYLALSHQVNRQWQILADYTWTGWDSIQDLTIKRTNGTTLTSTPLNFKNSWRVGLGANYQLNDVWKLRFGVAYDETPVQDEYRTPRLPDQDRTWLAVGAQYVMSKQLAFDFGFAYLFIDDSPSNLPNQDTPTSAPKGRLVGEYEASVAILSAQVRYSF